jgi:hypothetical protein
MASFAFQKFRSLEKRSSSTSRVAEPPIVKSHPEESKETTRTSPDPGLGSSVSSSSSSLQQPPLKKSKNIGQEPTKTDNFQSGIGESPPSLLSVQNKSGQAEKVSVCQENKENNKNDGQNMADLRADFFNSQLIPSRKTSREVKRENSASKDLQDESKKVVLMEKAPPRPELKRENSQTKLREVRRKSVEEGPGKKLDALTKGLASDIKGMFEENIAIKKGLIPDPTIPQGPTVKLRRKVNPNLPNVFRDQADDREQKKKNRESIPVNRKKFNHFLSKFEDDQSRQAAKAQLFQITKKQKDYLSKEAQSWSQKQEEKKHLEEQARLEEIARAEEEVRRKVEEEERLWQQQLKEVERKRQFEQEAEERERLAAKEAEEKKKKVKKKKRKSVEQTELPNLVSNTCSDLRKKFQDSLKATNDTQAKAPVTERPKVRRLMNNPFEKQVNNTDVAAVKRREFPVVRENRLGDIKKRFSQLIAPSEPIPVPPIRPKSDAIKPPEQVIEEMVLKTAEIATSIALEVTDLSPAPNQDVSPFSQKKRSMIQSSMDALKGSFEKLNNSKERLSDAFTKRKKGTKLSKNDMQSYLLSHVLYDGEMKVENVPERKDDLIDILEEEMNITEEDLLKDVKQMKQYLTLFDDDKKGKKKKKKKKKPEEPPPTIMTVQVNSIKQQFEAKRIQNKEGPSIVHIKELNEPVLCEPRAGKVRNLIESNFDQATQVLPKPKMPARRVNRMISNELLSKFDCPEMVDVLKKQRDDEREERKQQRLKKLEEERLWIEAERRRAQKLEEERLENERCEQLKKEEEARLEREKQEEQARMKIAYDEMIVNEKRKAAARQQHDNEMKQLREKSEPAFKQRKVLGRIQHIFEKKMEQDMPDNKKTVGSIKGVAKDLFSKQESRLNKPFQDPSLASTNGLLNNVKNIFESKEEVPVILSHGVHVKKKDIPAAMTFEANEEKMKKEMETLNTMPLKQETEWAWKKKNPGLLALEAAKLNADLASSASEKKKSSRVKKAFERQRELLDEIHSVNTRLAKKNALKEHEEKMEEYSKFMNEIQLYLTEPDQSVEESTFKDDIKNFITAKVTTKKKTTKPKKTDPVKPQANSMITMSINEIKEQLLQSTDNMDSKTFEKVPTGAHGKVDALKTSLIQQYSNDGDTRTEDFGADIKNSVHNIKGFFETENKNVGNDTDRTKVMKKIVQVPEFKEETAVRKSSYEWQYKKKSIQELQAFMSSNEEFVTNRVSKAVDTVGDLLEEVFENQPVNSEDAQIASYNKMMQEVELYLSGPDRSKEEIEFKDQLEKYLDVVETPTQEKEILNTTMVSRIPKKLNLSLFVKSQESESPTKDAEPSPSFYKSKESKTIKEIQSKLILESQSEITTPKEVLVHNTGTNELKRGFEKMNKLEEVVLMSAPKVTAQRFFGEYVQDVSSHGTKTLEQLKCEGKEGTWKWKQKTISDLHTFMSGHLNHASKAIVDSHKRILRADIELQNEQSAKKNPDKIRQLTKERDEELETFLASVKDSLDEPTNKRQEDSFKVGIQGYLNLIEDEMKEEYDSSVQVSQKRFLNTQFGQVSNLKKQLQTSNKNEVSMYQRAVGKVNTSFLEEQQPSVGVIKSNPGRFQDPVAESVRSDDIKHRLVSQFFDKKEPKETFKAPLRKLVQPPQESLPPPIREPQQLWVPKTNAATTHLAKPPVPSVPIPKKVEEPKKFVSKYDHMTKEEKEAAIMAQFGIKPRQIKQRDSSSSSSSDDEADINDYIENDLMKNNDLYVLYGDRLRAPSPTRKSRSRKPQKSSVDCIRGILGQIRQGSGSRSRHNLDSSMDSLLLDNSPTDKSHIIGSCSNFESDSDYKQVIHKQRSSKLSAVERSSSCTNVGTLFERSLKDGQQSVMSPSRPVPGRVLAPAILQNNAQSSPPGRGFLPGRPNELAKSASFNKFKQSFESGQFDEQYSDSDKVDDDVVRQTNQQSQIQSELNEIRSCPRLQKMFCINRPKSAYLSKSSSSSAVPDQLNQDEDEGAVSVSEARASIRNIFEASASKVTYGGGKTLTEQIREKEPETQPQQQQPKKKVQFADKTWVLDAINKYFDVIEEDEEEPEYEEDYCDEEDEEDCSYEEDYSEEEEDESPIFSTQISAQRFIYPTAAVPLQNTMTSAPDNYDEEDYYEEEDEDEDEEDDEEEEEYEVEDDEQAKSISLLQRSASSSKIRGLFNSVLQKSASGADFDMKKFKTNLGSHLQRRTSFSSNAKLNNQESSEDEEDFQDCSEIPYETSKYHRIPL